MDTTTDSTTTQNKVLTGCVKWFNNNLNYGFITVLTEGEHHNIDIFSHQTNIKTKRECFRTLYTGECVQFELAKSNNDKHPVHAINISGFNGCLLHCENPSYRASNGHNDNSGRGRGGGSRDGGSRDGGSRDGGSRDGGSRDGGSRDGGSRGRGGSSRGGSSRGGINRSNSTPSNQ